LHDGRIRVVAPQQTALYKMLRLQVHPWRGRGNRVGR
jgi:hypothetical protein